MKYLPLPMLVAILAATAFAEKPSELLEQLRTELRTELKSALDKGNGENNQRLFQIESLLVEQLPAGELPGDQLHQIVQTLGQLRMLSRAPKVEALCQSLITELRTQVAERDKRFKESFSSTIKDALETGLKATTAKELDAPLLALANLQKHVNAMERNSNNSRGLDSQQLSTATSILTLWQDSMLPRVGAQRGRDSLEQLESMAQSYTQQLGDLLPRSEFITLVNNARSRLAPALTAKFATMDELEFKGREILRGVKKLDDLGDAMLKIDKLALAADRVSINNTNSAQTLRKIHKLHEDLKAGMAVSLSSADMPSYSGETEEAGAIKAMVIKLALPRVLHVTGDAMPKDTESVSEYLARMLEDSRRKPDWQLLSRVIDTAQSLRLSTLIATSDAAALRTMLAGVNQERARQYTGAVAYYLAALRTGSQAVPSEAIGEKLEAIRKDHPQDYEAGQHFQIIEPASQRYSGPPYGPSGMPRVFTGPPSGMSAGATQATAPLLVPAAAKTEPAPAGSKKPEEIPKPKGATSGK